MTVTAWIHKGVSYRIIHKIEGIKKTKKYEKTICYKILEKKHDFFSMIKEFKLWKEIKKEEVPGEVFINMAVGNVEKRKSELIEYAKNNLGFKGVCDF